MQRPKRPVGTQTLLPHWLLARQNSPVAARHWPPALHTMLAHSVACIADVHAVHTMLLQYRLMQSESAVQAAARGLMQ